MKRRSPIAGASAQAVSVLSSTIVSAMTPAGSAGGADVTVNTSAGSATLTRAFTYSLRWRSAHSPGPAGVRGDVVTITGTNFDPDTSGNQVSINAETAVVSSASASTLVIAVLAGH